MVPAFLTQNEDLGRILFLLTEKSIRTVPEEPHAFSCKMDLPERFRLSSL
jgi:hypothetical protein